MCDWKFLKTYYTIEIYVRPRENTLESEFLWIGKLISRVVAFMGYRTVFEAPENF
jgi:hypothetical protein